MTTTRQATSNTEGNGATTGYEAARLDAAIAETLEKLGFGER